MLTETSIAFMMTNSSSKKYSKNDVITKMSEMEEEYSSIEKA